MYNQPMVISITDNLCDLLGLCCLNYIQIYLNDMIIMHGIKLNLIDE